MECKAALYVRLSKEDATQSESESITNQKTLLIKYAQSHNFAIYDIYSDDGYSGTNFERPALLRLIEDIKNKNVNLVITKDLSRLGRDYIKTGEFTEVFFPKHNVRYIAVDDGYDSILNNNDIMPFKNVINELYARDISKKIRSALKSKMQSGLYTGNFASYGYKKDSQNKNKLVIDFEASEIVKLIFLKLSEGLSPVEIANYLNEQQVYTPSQYRCIKFPHLKLSNYTKNNMWSRQTICKIARNEIYIGNTAQGKTAKANFKSKAVINKSRDEWFIVKNTHVAIVDEKLFYLANEKMNARSYRINRKDVKENAHIFKGIAKCAHCGKNMQLEKEKLVCLTYKQFGKTKCSNHYAKINDLTLLILHELKLNIGNQAFPKRKINDLALREQKQVSDRLKKIDVLIKNLYEEKVFGNISQERFLNLVCEYEQEQRALRCNYNAIQEIQNDDTPTQIKIETLNADILHKLIQKIEVQQSEQGTQAVKIFYRFDNCSCAWDSAATLPESFPQG